MIKKVQLVNSGDAWDANRRYKINSIVTHNGLDWQNTTGKNSEPGVGNDWKTPSDTLQQVATAGNTFTDGVNSFYINPDEVGVSNGLGSSSSLAIGNIKTENDNGERTNLQPLITDYVKKNDGFVTNVIVQGQNAVANASYTQIRPNKSGIYAMTNDLPQVPNNFATDALAAAGGIPVGGLYHTAGIVKIRLT